MNRGIGNLAELKTLWTYHRPPFSVDTAPGMDYTQGTWWNDPHYKDKFRPALLKFYEVAGTHDFLWCYDQDKQRLYEAGEEKWEIEITPQTQLRFYRELVWNDIWEHGIDAVDKLMVEPEVYNQEERIGILAIVPLPPNTAKRCPLPDTIRPGLTYW
jgi:hypothetical protein